MWHLLVRGLPKKREGGEAWFLQIVDIGIVAKRRTEICVPPLVQI